MPFWTMHRWRNAGASRRDAADPSAELLGDIGALDPSNCEVAANPGLMRDPDELHDALLTLVWVPDTIQQWQFLSAAACRIRSCHPTHVDFLTIFGSACNRLGSDRK